ncbi:hypothetical protein [Nitrospira sp. Nam74]
MKARKITGRPVMARPTVTPTITSGSAISQRRSHRPTTPTPLRALPDTRSHEDDFTIVRPRESIPIERTLNGRRLLLHFGKTTVVLTASEARRLAYSLLLEAETTPARSHGS